MHVRSRQHRSPLILMSPAPIITRNSSNLIAVNKIANIVDLYWRGEIDQNSLIMRAPNVAQQLNNFDCGIYMLLFLQFSRRATDREELLRQARSFTRFDVQEIRDDIEATARTVGLV